MTGTVHIVETARSGVGSRVFSVTFARIGTGGSLSPRECRDVGSLRAFLRSTGIDDRSIQDALDRLDAAGNASIPNVELSQEVLAELGLS